MKNILNFDNIIKFTIFFIIITLPIVAMPKRFCIPGLGGNLSYYFSLLLLFLVTIKVLRKRIIIDNIFKKYILLLSSWLLITSVYGAYTYPYYNEISLNNSSFYIWSTSFFDGYYDSDFVVRLFLFFRSIRDGFLLLIMPWLVGYAIYLSLRKDGLKGVSFVINSYFCLGIIVLIYAIPEILLFKFNMSIGHEILLITNKYLYDVNSYLGWYPPLIWHNQQLRSLCIEPASLGVLSIMIISCLWCLFFQKKSIFLIFVYCFFFTMPIMSKSRTAVLVCAFMLCQLSLYILDKSIRKKDIIKVLVASAISVLFAITSFSVLEVGVDHSSQKNSFKGYYEDNVKTIASTKARSNGSRLTNIRNHLNVIALKPVFGTGMFYKDLYVRDNMVDSALDEPEIYNITKGLEKDGIFKYSYGNVNHYVFLACSIGVPGLLLFFLPAMYVLYQVFKFKLFKNSISISLIIALNTFFLIMNVGVPEPSFFIVTSLLFLLINYTRNIYITN